MRIFERLKEEHLDFFLVYGFSICAIISLSVINFFSAFEKNFNHTISANEVVTVPHNTLTFNPLPFESVTVEGRAYVVYDIVSGTVIAGKNETIAMPLASLTKVMTALTATLHYPEDKKIIITDHAIDGSYDLGLRNKQTWSLDELLKYTLVFSSNDGAEAVAENFGSRDSFLEQMNQDARGFGLNLTFKDPAGLDDRGTLGGRGTALDVAKLFSVARKVIPDVLDATTKKRQTVLSSSGRISGVPNTNQTIEEFPGAEASKTGYTDLAGGNLGIVVDISVGRPVVIVVLGSTRQGRFNDVKTLYKALQKSVVTN